MDSLIERLMKSRRSFMGYSITHHNVGTNFIDVAFEAADALEQQQARISTLEIDRNTLSEYLVDARSDNKAQQARIDALENPWIPVSTDLPIDGDIVIVHGGCAHHETAGWYSHNELSGGPRPIQWKVEYWMPLSALPSPPPQNG